MSSRNHNHVEFSNRSETVVAFSHDRGVLKTNGFGDYFFRGTNDNRFACCAPELERKLIDMGIRAGERVSIKKAIRNRITTWQVRRMDASAEPVEAPHREGWPHVAPLPERVYAKLDAPDPDWEDLAQPATEAARVQTTAPAPVVTVQESPVTTQSITPDSLLARCLCEAIDAAKAGQAHAAAIGFPLTFSSSDIQDLASTIFIQRCRDGAILERMSMPPARQASKANGAAVPQTH